MVSALVSVVTSASLVLAEYTVVLKNGRRITVKSYREEGSMIKIHGLGGELGIPKDQVQAIVKAGATESQGLSLSELEAASRQSPTRPSSPPSESLKEAAKPGETRPAANTEQEKEYQKRLAEITQKLEAAKQDLLNATQRGGGASDVSKEGFRAWAADFGSRIRDSQKVPGGGGPPGTPPMPPIEPTYTPREKEISDLRIQVDSLQKERDSLIEEMKSKNIPLVIDIGR